MASLNPFDLLGDDDAEDPSLLLAAQQKAAALASAPGQPKKSSAQSQPAAKPSSKMSSKPLPLPEPVLRGGRSDARGRGFNREGVDNINTNGFSGDYNPSGDRESVKAPSERHDIQSRPRGGFSNGETEEGARRMFERRSGTGRGTEVKREGAGRGNWGTPKDEVLVETVEPTSELKNGDSEKETGQDEVGEANKDSSANEQETKPEEKEMTLEEYEKVLEEKRKALLALKSEERKVNLDKELESMLVLSNKKNDDEIFIKLGSDKEKRKEAAEKAKKSVSINEFLKPAQGENLYRAGGRGRGPGRGRGGGFVGGRNDNYQAPAIEDVGHFPSLGVK